MTNEIYNQLYSSIENIETTYTNSFKPSPAHNSFDCLADEGSDIVLDNGEESEDDEFLIKLSIAKEYFEKAELIEGRDEIKKAQRMIQGVKYIEQIDPANRDSIVQEISTVCGLVRKLQARK